MSRCVDPATGALGTLQSGEIDMLGRGDYLIQSGALADQDSWHGAVPEADWAGVEQNADHALGLTLDALRGEAFIDRGANGAPSKLQAALATAKSS